LKEEIKFILKVFKQKILTLKPRTLEKEALKQRFEQACIERYQFHQNIVLKNPELLNWILKSDYWDYNLPKLHITS